MDFPYQNDPQYTSMPADLQDEFKSQWQKGKWEELISDPSYHGLHSDEQDSLHEDIFGKPRNLIDKARDMAYTYDEAGLQGLANAVKVGSFGILQAQNAIPTLTGGEFSATPETTYGKIGAGAGSATGFVLGGPGKLAKMIGGGVRALASSIPFVGDLLAGTGMASKAANIATGAVASGVGLGTAGVAADIPSMGQNTGQKFFSNAVTGSFLPFVEGLPIGKVGRGLIGAAIFGRAYQPGDRTMPEIIADSLIGGAMTMGYRSFDLQGEPFAKFGKMNETEYRAAKHNIEVKDQAALAEQVEKIIQDQDAKVIIGKTATQNLLGTDLTPGKDFWVRDGGNSIVLTKSYLKGMMDDLANADSMDDLKRHGYAIRDMGDMISPEWKNKFKDLFITRANELKQQEAETPSIQTANTPQQGNTQLLNDSVAMLQSMKMMGKQQATIYVTDLLAKNPSIKSPQDVIASLGQKPQAPDVEEQAGTISPSYVKDIESQVENGEFGTSDKAAAKAQEIEGLLKDYKPANKEERALVARLEPLVKVFNDAADMLAQKEAGMQSDKALNENKPQSIISWLRSKGGIGRDKAGDLAGEVEGIAKKESGVSGIVTRKGQSLDILAQLAEEAGLIEQGEGTRGLINAVNEELTRKANETNQPNKARRRAVKAQASQQEVPEVAHIREQVSGGLKNGMSKEELLNTFAPQEANPALRSMVSRVIDEESAKISTSSTPKEGGGVEAPSGNLADLTKQYEELHDKIGTLQLAGKDDEAAPLIEQVNKIEAQIDSLTGNEQAKSTQETMATPKKELRSVDINKGDMIITKNAGSVKVTKTGFDADNNWYAQYRGENGVTRVRLKDIISHTPSLGAAGAGEVSDAQGVVEDVKSWLEDKVRRLNVMFNPALGLGEKEKYTFETYKGDGDIADAKATGLRIKGRALLTAMGFHGKMAQDAQERALGMARVLNTADSRNMGRYDTDLSRYIEEQKTRRDALRPTSKADRQLIDRLNSHIDYCERLQSDIEAAKNLSDPMKEVLSGISKIFDTGLQALKDSGIPITARDNYLKGITTRDADGSLFQAKGYSGLPKSDLMASTGQLGEQGRSIIQRKVFANPIEAALHGYQQDYRLINNAAEYTRDSGHLMAGRQFVESMTDMTDIHGNGAVVPITHDTISKASDSGYEIVNILGKNYAVLKDMNGVKLAAFLRNEFTASPETTKPLMKYAANINMQLKNIKTIGSGFHWVQESIRALTSGVNPLEWKKGQEDLANQDPTVMRLVKEGLTLGGRMDYGGEDMMAMNLKRSGVAGTIQHITEITGTGKLFDEFIPSIKVLAAKAGLARNRQLYPDMDETRLYRLTADQINSRFGIRDLSRLGRDKTIQAAFRLMAFAPDWTENQFRSLVGSFGSEGKAQLEWQMKNMAFAVGITQILNYAFTGHSTLQNSGGVMGALSVETPFQDDKGNPMHVNLLGPAAFPINLAMNAPKLLAAKGSVLVRMAEEQLSGKDWRGRPFATLEDMQKGKFYGTPQHQGFWETLPGRGLAIANETAPILVEGVIKAATKEGSWPQAAGGTFGFPVSRTKPNDKSIAEILAGGQ